MKNQKLRYYLRGLGIGILVTAVIMGIAGKDTETLTDAQIRERAMELGMVDSNSLVLAELQKGDEQVAETTEQSEETATAPAETEAPETAETEPVETEPIETESESEPTESTATEEAEPTEDANATAELEPTESAVEPSDTETQDETQAQNETESQAETDSQTETATQSTDAISIAIRAGASSYTVAKDLAAAGLVADAKAFDTYLCDNGYSQSIHIGTYEIMPGATEEEIAKIITGKK